MTIAQIANLNANTQKTKAEAEKIGGADTENTKADTAVKNATAEIAKIAAKVSADTEKDQIQQITYAAAEQVQKAREQFNKAQVSEETQRAQINQIKASAIGELIKNALMKSDIKKNSAQIEEIQNGIKQKWEQVAQGWKGLNQRDKEIAIKKFETELKANYPNLFEVGGRIAEDFIDTSWNLLEGKGWGSYGTRPKHKNLK